MPRLELPDSVDGYMVLVTDRAPSGRVEIGVRFRGTTYLVTLNNKQKHELAEFILEQEASDARI